MTGYEVGSLVIQSAILMVALITLVVKLINNHKK